MRALYRKRMGRHTPTAKTRLKKKTGGSKRKVGGGVKRSAAKAVQPKKLSIPKKRLAGKSFCLTGTMSLKRDALSEAIKRAGGTVHSSLKADTDYLVKGVDPGKTKLAAAKKHGTTVITEKKLITMW
jgi:DNA ligase (NAD+)